MLKVKEFQFNMWGVNTYVVYDTDSLEAAVIDPGMINASEEKIMADFIEANNLKVTHLVNTHLHIDHTFGDDFIRTAYGVPLEAHEADAFLGNGRQAQARMFGLGITIDPVAIDVPVKEGDRIYIGKDYLEAIHVPGHSPGSIVLYSPAGGFAIAGDVLFQNSIGRTDLVAGDHALLIKGITDKLLTLPDSTIVYPGHGPSTTIGNEKRFNPFI